MTESLYQTHHGNGEPIISIVPIEISLDHRLSLIQTRVLIALFSYRNKSTGLASVRRSVLSQRCGYSLAKISTATSELVKLGWLQKSGNDGGCNRAAEYTITVPELGTVPYPGTVPELGRGGVPDSGRGGVPDSGTRKEQSIEQNIEQSIEQNNNAREASPPALFTQPAKKIRATRLPPDWKPSADLKLWAARELNTSPTAVDRVTDGFRDYWTSLPGQKGTKLDWNATFRNWVRRQADTASSKKYERKTVGQLNQEAEERARIMLFGEDDDDFFEGVCTHE